MSIASNTLHAGAALLLAALLCAPADAQPQATFEEAQRHDTGQGVPLDRAKARQLYAAAARQGSAPAAYALARHHSGLTGETVDLAQAHRYTKQAAEAGHVPAQVDLGFLYMQGNAEVPKDLAAALRWFRSAAGQGAVRAQCMLGDFHANGWGGARQDHAEAVRWYARSATQPDACASRAQLALYTHYRSGLGVRKDLQAAMAWLQQSAEAGNPSAQRALGKAYQQGDGVAQDEGLARVWLRKSRQGVAPHDDHGHDMPSFAGPELFKKLAPFSQRAP